jgi:phosphoribosylamine-glycine ligase
MHPMFIKAAGLCKGKGAFPAETNAEAEAAIMAMPGLEGGAGRKFLIEEWLKNADGSNGEEVSVFIGSDGKVWKPIGAAQDHKRRGNGDTGGILVGWGAVPYRWCSPPACSYKPTQ